MRSWFKRTYYRLFPVQYPQSQYSKDLERDDTFNVATDGSISLNYKSKVVQKAFSKNIKKLQSMKTEK